MIAEPAPAKINLALHVRRRRPDGYHELETLFAFARDGDVVTVEPAAAWSFAMTGPFASDLPSGGSGWADNLVTRAADAFRRAFPDTPPHAIVLDKHLPIASGIGGGSADAAATLRALARSRGVATDDPRLAAIALPLGADVPACLLGRTTQGSGIGEALTPIAGLPGTPLLLVNPRVAVSTAAVFGGWDGVDRGALPMGSLLERARAARNDLAAPAKAVAPVIEEVEAMLAAAPGALVARMSGSGATCFALFGDDASRDVAARDAKTRGWWTLLTTLA
jgi:4-diphosphocytidyl-2-C-methyl-D-erythritol kinase